MDSNIAHYRKDLFEFLKTRGWGLPGVSVTLALLGIAGSEATIFYGYLGYGLWGFLITLLLCVLGPLRFQNEANTLQALALVPVFRIVNLGMPVFSEYTLYWLPLVYGPFIPAGYLVVRYQPDTSLPMGMLRALLVLPIAIPVSAGIGIIEYSIFSPVPLLEQWTRDNVLFVGVILFGFVALAEELLFRGIIQRIFENQMGRWSGFVLASGLFGLLHSGYGASNELLFAIGVGLYLGAVYDYVESFVLVVLMRGTIEFILFVVVPFHPWLVSSLYQYLPV